MINSHIAQTITLAPLRDLYWTILGGVSFLGVFCFSILSLITTFVWIGSVFIPTDYFFISLCASPVFFGGSLFFSKKASYCLERASYRTLPFPTRHSISSSATIAIF